MKKINYLNLFSDFLLSKLSSESSSLIQTIDFDNFLVVKGETSDSEILNLVELKDEFILKFSEFIEKDSLPTIDLIKYNVNVPKLKKIKITYNNNDEENNLFNYSKFPYGRSLDQGRLLYYYGLHILNNIPSNYIHGEITMELTTNKKKLEELFKIKNNNVEDDQLKSAILDIFDFDMRWIEEEIKKVDFLNPLEKFDFLNKKVEGFIII